MTKSIEEIVAILTRPFNATEVKFKPQTVSGNRALALPYVDSRTVMDRLDEAVGIDGWEDKYMGLPDGNVKCTLTIWFPDGAISKEDVGGESAQSDEGDRCKAAFSDSLKRAAVKFGVGRHLYREKPQWVDYDPQKKAFKRQPVLGGAIAATIRTEEVVRPVYPAQPDEEDPGMAFLLSIQKYDSKLAGEGLIKVGELLRHIEAKGKTAGLPDDLSRWHGLAIGHAREWTRAFVGERKPKPAARSGPTKTVAQALDDYDADLARQGVCAAGALKAFVRTEVIKQRPDAGMNMERWADAEWVIARKAAVAFQKSQVTA